MIKILIISIFIMGLSDISFANGSCQNLVGRYECNFSGGFIFVIENPNDNSKVFRFKVELKDKNVQSAGIGEFFDGLPAGSETIYGEYTMDVESQNLTLGKKRVVNEETDRYKATKILSCNNNVLKISTTRHFSIFSIFKGDMPEAQYSDIEIMQKDGGIAFAHKTDSTKSPYRNHPYAAESGVCTRMIEYSR